MVMNYVHNEIRFSLIISMLCLVSSYGSGAPRGTSVCKHLQPNHHVTPQKDKCPFVIIANVTSEYFNHYVVNITLKSFADDRIKGFAVQISTNAESRDKDTVVGKFQALAEVQTLTCFSESDTATHMNKEQKTAVNILANVPKGQGSTKVYIRATILKEYDIFWNDVISVVSFASDPYTLSSIGNDVSKQWTEFAYNTATYIEAGRAKWHDDIIYRLNIGFDGMINTKGHLQTKEIIDGLPFKDKYPKRGSDSTSGGLYKSIKYLDGNLSQNDVIGELLMGDIRFGSKVNMNTM